MCIGLCVYGRGIVSFGDTLLYMEIEMLFPQKTPHLSKRFLGWTWVSLTKATPFTVPTALSSQNGCTLLPPLDLEPTGVWIWVQYPDPDATQPECNLGPRAILSTKGFLSPKDTWEATRGGIPDMPQYLSSAAQDGLSSSSSWFHHSFTATLRITPTAEAFLTKPRHRSATVTSRSSPFLSSEGVSKGHPPSTGQLSQACGGKSVPPYAPPQHSCCSPMSLLLPARLRISTLRASLGHSIVLISVSYTRYRPRLLSGIPFCVCLVCSQDYNPILSPTPIDIGLDSLPKSFLGSSLGLNPIFCNFWLRIFRMQRTLHGVPHISTLENSTF